MGAENFAPTGIRSPDRPSRSQPHVQGETDQYKSIVVLTHISHHQCFRMSFSLPTKNSKHVRGTSGYAVGLASSQRGRSPLFCSDSSKDDKAQDSRRYWKLQHSRLQFIKSKHNTAPPKTPNFLAKLQFPSQSQTNNPLPPT